MKRRLLFLIIIVILIAGCVPATNAPQADPVSDPAPASPSSPPDAASTSQFTLTSPDLPEDGRLPAEYTCDGDGLTPALEWSGAPEGTAGYAVIMHHVAGPDEIHWYWVPVQHPRGCDRPAEKCQ